MIASLYQSTSRLSCQTLSPRSMSAPLCKAGRHASLYEVTTEEGSDATFKPKPSSRPKANGLQLSLGSHSARGQAHIWATDRSVSRQLFTIRDCAKLTRHTKARRIIFRVNP
jgi:hypothetical protein